MDYQEKPVMIAPEQAIDVLGEIRDELSKQSLLMQAALLASPGARERR